MPTPCPSCHTRTMVRRVGATEIFHECPCGATSPGCADDRAIASGGLKKVDRSETYAAILQNAPHSRTMCRVAAPCDECGLPYMTQVRVDSEETIIRACKCGHRVSVR